jgi:sulfate-transporting ATPase
LARQLTSWLEQKEQRLSLEERQQGARRRAIRIELEWVRSNPKGRQAKSKARLARFEALASQNYQRRSETQQIYIPPGPRLGELVFEASHVKKSYGDRLLIEDLSFQLPRGGIIGVIGANGAGKTTLLRMLAGTEKPDAGQIRLGDTVKLAVAEQTRAKLKGDESVWEAISEGEDLISAGNYQIASRAYVSRFNFRGQDQEKRVRDLSGGGRNRVQLACTLREGANVILLDEPTNDLDVETLRALEEALLDFPGCAVIVSHDRWFLDRIATHILAFEGDSRVTWFQGNYGEYEADRGRRLGEGPEPPHRIKFKRPPV